MYKRQSSYHAGDVLRSLRSAESGSCGAITSANIAEKNNTEIITPDKIGKRDVTRLVLAKKDICSLALASVEFRSVTCDSLSFISKSTNNAYNNNNVNAS